MALRLVDNNLELENIDEWCSQVKCHKDSAHMLSRKFFQQRVVNKRNAHIKAFAAETICAITLLGFFLQVVVAPMKISGLQENLESFALLVCILNLLKERDITKCDKLRQALQTHHFLFGRCYPTCVKPKLHMAKHIVDSWLYWKVLLDCFSPERRHKFYKGICKFSYKLAGCTALNYAVRSWIGRLYEKNTFEPVFFDGNVIAVPDLQVSLQGVGPARVIAWSHSLRTTIGPLRKDDLVDFVGSDGRCSLGFALGFAKLETMDGQRRFFSIAIDPCEPRARNWVRTFGEGFIMVDQVVRARHWWSLGGGTFVPAC